MTITDPETYTKPWVAETKIFTRVPRSEWVSENWYGMMEELCVPLDEVHEFNEKIRNPAGGVTQP